MPLNTGKQDSTFAVNSGATITDENTCERTEHFSTDLIRLSTVASISFVNI